MADVSKKSTLGGLTHYTIRARSVPSVPTDGSQIYAKMMIGKSKNACRGLWARWARIGPKKRLTLGKTIAKTKWATPTRKKPMSKDTAAALITAGQARKAILLPLLTAALTARDAVKVELDAYQGVQERFAAAEAEAVQLQAQDAELDKGIQLADDAVDGYESAEWAMKAGEQDDADRARGKAEAKEAQAKAIIEPPPPAEVPPSEMPG